MQEFIIYPQPQKTAIDPTSGLTRAPSTIACSQEVHERTDAFFRSAGVPVALSPASWLHGFSLCSERQAAVGDGPMPPHGYVLRISSPGIGLRASDLAGWYAGLQSLWQLLEHAGPLPCATITDAPALPVRSFQIDLARQPETVAEIKRVIRQQARYHFNECQLYIENGVKLPAFGAAADPEGLAPDEFAELARFSSRLGIDLVPSLNLLGHMEKVLRHPDFRHLAEIQDAPRHARQNYRGDLCPELPEARRFVSNIIRQMSELSPSPKLMVGLDECWTLGSHPLSRQRLDANHGAGPIFRDWICFLHDHVTRAGKQMWMWEDMLFYHKGALQGIPRDIGMNIWHYQHVEEYPMYSFQNWGRIDSVGTLASLGHPVMLCTGPQPDHLHSLIRYAEGYPIDGLLVVQWEGSGTVQECYALNRALAAGVLWTGDLPDSSSAARAATRCSPGQADALGDLLVQDQCHLPSKGGGSESCPRFWSWPENVLAEQQTEAMLRNLDRAGVTHESLDVRRAFLAHRAVSLQTDCARETAALVGRAMLQKGLKSSPMLDQAIASLEKAADIARSIQEKGEEFHQRYCAGLSRRPMVAHFAEAPKSPEALLEKLRRFRDNPCPETWPFCRFSLHLDAIVVDPCAHYVAVEVSQDGQQFQSVYSGGFRIGSAEVGHTTIMSLALDQSPRFVRLEVGGFASLAFTRVRLESLAGTRLPVRVAEYGGDVRDPEHLLRFDNTMTVFNRSDVLSNWLSLTPLPRNFVVLGFEPI